MEETINIEEIMQQIRAEIKEKGYSADMLSFQDVECPAEKENFHYDEKECLDIVNCVNRDSHIPWTGELNQGGVKAFVKKIIRKLTGFLIAPIVERQNQFNSDVTRSINQFMGYMEQQNEKIENYERDIGLLEEKIAELQKQLNSK